jgi:trigger factor
MKIEVTDHSEVKKTMSVEVDADVVAAETERVVRRYSRQVRIPGFRAGKAPISLVRSRFAKEIEDDVRDTLIGKLYGEAAKERGFRPIGDPVLDEVSHETGQPFRIKTTFEIAPDIEPKGYRGVEVRREAVRVGEDDVDKVLEEIRESNARLRTEEGRAAATGDFVVADVEGDTGEEGGEPMRREKALLEVGATDNLPEFNDGLEGAKSGEVREFSVPYPPEYPAESLAGKTVRYRVAVHEVKVKEFPDLDDEFAKDLGEFEDLAALRARVREDLETRRREEAESKVRRDVLDKILLENPVPLPEVLVESEIRHRLEDLVRNLMMQGIDPSKMELDWKELRERQEEGARKSVHARLLLDAIASAEGIEADSKEVDRRIRGEAERIQEPYEDLRERLRKGGGMEALAHQIVREKSLDLVTSVANIRDEG